MVRVMHPTRIALTACGVLLAGCGTLNPSVMMDSYSIQDRRDGTFQVNVAPGKYKELTDAGPQDVRAFLNGVVLRRRLCQTGYTTDDPVTHWGHVAIAGRCNPPPA